MTRVLGIDTGGTFTDSVVIETSTQSVLCKAKSQTTKQNLSIGIEGSVSQLPPELREDISYVSLSTTLATNAIVEGKHCRVGAILLGTEVEEELPAEIVREMTAKINIKGRQVVSIDYKHLDQIIDEMRGQVEVIAISGFSSIRNPVHEKSIRKYIREKWNVPVVCAHEMSGMLGFYERTVTCIINAGLMPIIADLIESTKRSISKLGIDAPIMIVKGDGSLMHESVALERPVETLLSGPAASVSGAMFLTDMQYGLILDMGGTTTDIADLTNGKVKIATRGASVGDWFTRVTAADICTFGLGGDSYIYYDNNGEVCIGPRKVRPISSLAEHYPYIVNEMRQYRKPQGYELLREKSTDCYSYLREPQVGEIEGIKRKVLDTLKSGAHSLFWLVRHLECDADKLGLSELVDMGCVERASMTPTDLLIAEGHLNIFNKDGADVALETIASVGNVTKQEFIISTKRLIYKKIASLCVRSAYHYEGKTLTEAEHEIMKYFIDLAFDSEEARILKTSFSLAKPIIAIGAPVRAWLYNVGQYLSTTVMIPEHSEVANAVGAAIAEIAEKKQATIRHDGTFDKYTIYTSDGRYTCASLDEAKDVAENMVREAARKAAEASGSDNCEIALDSQDKYSNIFTSGRKEYVETIITAMAIGKPKWRKD